MNERQKKALRAVVAIVAAGGRDVRSAELAETLGISRESVYQLLLPLVREGLVIAGRGRTGGYRGTADLAHRSSSEVLAPYAGRVPGGDEGHGGPPWIEELQERARTAAERVYAAVRVADLVEAARRSRGTPDWQI